MDRHSWDERYGGDELVWSAGPNERFASIAAGLSAGTALDLGAGEGRNAVWLAREGWEVTAVDFSEVGLATARRRAEAAGVTVATTVGDLTQFRPPRGAFDLVAAIYLQLDREDRPGVYRA
ncbi:MAG: class I SAM-dependent methyltransferase, partial [Actinomycetota bacterium]